MTEFLDGCAVEAATAIRRGEISSRALTEALLARIDQRNPAINAVVALRRDDALAEATAADEAVSTGADVGPLHGVPMTVKESFDVSGMGTTWGNPAFAAYRAKADAEVVRRLRAAGAVIVGKSNIAFMLSDNQTDNELYGRTDNPWQVQRTPGGSSGGAAAAIATGMSFLEFGSDLSGSVRNPAAFCGVFGLRPTSGVVPQTGHRPPGPAGVPLGAMCLPTIGPIARSAQDLRAALEVVAGPEQPESMALTWSLPAPRHRRLADFRVGYVLDDLAAPVDADVTERLAAAIDSVRASGAHVVEGWPHGVDPQEQFQDFGSQIEAFFALHGDGALSHRDFVALDNRRIDARAVWARYFDRFDVFLCPTNIGTAFPHDGRPFEQRMLPGGRPYHEQFFWTAHATLAGLPAATAPAGLTANGLPVGMQIVGPHYEDDTVLTFAELGPFEFTSPG
ncbi:amidase family protein [Antrihabitans cavernicola]|uniref:Amidase n=1 Tax=Antrihabitans cavernicola TaxID=2495913 RepID=A0A5A7S9Q4_9NOCA|nr:amidase family protein [Spelaeibacter cavernicola]KAA0021313.1 amidase [Spelaeibacter cavernicola]